MFGTQVCESKVYCMEEKAKKVFQQHLNVNK